MSQRSPFQGLDAFEAADYDRFFGRDRQVTELYNRVHAAKLTLLYGLSGTGKSSLVRCGLANRFGPREWLPVFIRRGKDIRQSITDALYLAWREAANPGEAHGNSGADAGAEEETKSNPTTAEIIAALQEGRPLEFGEEVTKVQFPTKAEFQALPTLEEQVARVYNDLYRPIYLIFDQFEELYTINPFQKADVETYDAVAREQWEAERQDFYKAVRNLLDAERIAARIILIMREEWWGRMRPFEKKVPKLNKNRMLVERMGEAEIAEVIQRTVAFSQEDKEYRDIYLSDPQQEDAPKNAGDAVIKGIIEAVRDRRSYSIDLIDLQIYLKRLLDTFPEGTTAHFTKELVAANQLDDVLDNFLTESLEAIEKALAERFRQVDPTLASATYREQAQGVPLEVLFRMVTDQGTKRVTTEEAIVDAPFFRLRKVSADDVRFVLRKLADYKLINSNEA